MLYVGTDGRVIFNSKTLRVAGAIASLLYTARLQLSLRVCRSIGRMAVKQFLLDYLWI